MKQPEMDSEVLYLPQEIIRNILKRLPVKSLIRFQCVCKHWTNLIKSPSFIADHLQQSSKQNPSLLFDCNSSDISLRWRLHFLDCGFQLRAVQKAHLIDSEKFASIVNSCNGLLCVEINECNDSPPSLSLWNPATTAVRHVPRVRTDCLHFFDECVTGFGFSPIVNDFKIVRTYAELFDPVSLVEVFSLSRGSWKVIEIGNLKGVKLYSETVTANGIIFWSGVKLGAEQEGEDNVELEEDEYDMMVGEDEVEVIVSFDVATEVFTVIPRPDLDYNANEKLTVYENKLAVLCDIWEDDDETPDLIELWVLDSGTCASGETWSWTKRYTSSPLSCAFDSRTIWRNEIACIPGSKEDNEKGKNVLRLMNLTNNEVKRFVISNCGPSPRIYNYVESLVPVGNN